MQEIIVKSIMQKKTNIDPESILCRIVDRTGFVKAVRSGLPSSEYQGKSNDFHFLHGIYQDCVQGSLADIIGFQHGNQRFFSIVEIDENLAGFACMQTFSENGVDRECLTAIAVNKPYWGHGLSGVLLRGVVEEMIRRADGITHFHLSSLTPDGEKYLPKYLEPLMDEYPELVVHPGYCDADNQFLEEIIKKSEERILPQTFKY